jgi:hypothetical protein
MPLEYKNPQTKEFCNLLDCKEAQLMNYLRLLNMSRSADRKKERWNRVWDIYIQACVANSANRALQVPDIDIIDIGIENKFRRDLRALRLPRAEPSPRFRHSH